jgi:hypothetical protein
MLDWSKVLAGLPPSLRGELQQAFESISRNYLERRWEPSELNGGKFCEVVYSILNGLVTGTMPAAAAKPSNMAVACRALEQAPANSARVGDHSIRVLIPRMLIAIYDVRNYRNVGHVGGDVDPNHSDATAVYMMASWVLAELIRIHHGISTDEAQAIVDALVERKIPLIWQLGEVKRVLDHSMPPKDQALVLLYSSVSGASSKQLTSWIEYSTVGNLRAQVLKPLHDKRLIEFDRESDRSRISPKGVEEVETRILK